MKRSLALVPLLPLLLSGCVSASRYDAAVQSADHAEQALRTTSNKLSDVQKKLDDAEVDRAHLRGDLDRLQTSSGELSTNLQASQRELDDIRTARAVADARAIFYRDVALRLKSMVDSGDLAVTLRDGRMVLLLPSDVLFDSGKTEIKPRGRETLEKVAAVLASFPTRSFQIAGHTDNIPIDTARFRSNWELSSARAVEVGRLLVACGMKPERLSAAGYGEFDPVGANDSSDGRAHNRRIEITVPANVDALVSVPAKS